ncbi:hypothetical protein ACF061_06430 [Streptomyces sp. NPDC015220]|uniref:hypothetical protein n=1 Tax=Streptomyces sp. NPDC015220 TaxID=3364947 RepID=UPI0036F9FA84
MRIRPATVLALLLSMTALTGACTEQERRPESPAESEEWPGKAEQEDAMERAERALDSTEPDGAARVDEGMETRPQGLERTFPAKGNRPYTLGVACQAPVTDRSVTLTLERGAEVSEYEVTCGDREADLFNVPAGAPFTARISPDRRDTHVMVLWRLDTIAPDDVHDCEDDITGCDD